MSNFPKRAIFSFIAALIPLSLVLTYVALRPRKPIAVPQWLCGFRHEYSDVKLLSNDYYIEFQEALGKFYKLVARRPKIRFSEPLGDKVVIYPWIVIGRAIGELRRIQVGHVQIYIAILLILLIILLIVWVIT